MDNLLYFAICTKNTELVRTHLERGVNPDEPYRDGRSALMIAADRNSEDIFQLLLDHNADISVCDREGRSLSERLTQMGQLKFYNLLQTYLNKQSTTSAEEIPDEYEDEDDFAELFSDLEFVTLAEANPEKDFRDEVVDDFSSEPKFQEEYPEEEYELFEVPENEKIPENEIIPEFQEFPAFCEAEITQIRRFYTFAVFSETIPDSMVYDLCKDLCLQESGFRAFCELLEEAGVSVTLEDSPGILEWFRKQYVKWPGNDEYADDFDRFLEALEEEIRFCTVDCLQHEEPKKINASSREIMESIKATAGEVWDFVCANFPVFKVVYVFLQYICLTNAGKLTSEQRKQIQKLYGRMTYYIKNEEILKSRPQDAARSLGNLANNLAIVNMVLHDLCIYSRPAPTDWNGVPADWSRYSGVLHNQFEQLKEQTKNVILALTNTVRSHIRKFEGIFPEDMEDIMQIAFMGVIRGVYHYDFTMKSHIQAYVSFWIFQKIQRDLCDEKLFIRLPVHMVNFSKEENRVRVETDSFNLYFPYDEKNRMPSLESLNSDELEKWCIENHVTYEPDFTQRNYKDLQSSILNAFEFLPERHRKVLMVRYGLDGAEALTLEQTASLWGITRERVRQLEQNAIKRLRVLMPDIHAKDLITMLEYCEDE